MPGGWDGVQKEEAEALVRARTLAAGKDGSEVHLRSACVSASGCELFKLRGTLKCYDEGQTGMPYQSDLVVHSNVTGNPRGKTSFCARAIH